MNRYSPAMTILTRWAAGDRLSSAKLLPAPARLQESGHQSYCTRARTDHAGSSQSPIRLRRASAFRPAISACTSVR